MFNISFGCCRHSVSTTFVQLTERRSVRDQPKQPPAKKPSLERARHELKKIVYDFACLAGLKNCEEVAGCVFGVDKFHFFSACLHVHVFSQDPAVQKSFNN